MVSIIKLKLDDIVFEIGKDKIKHINFDEEKGLIKIRYEKGFDWDERVIPIHRIGSIWYKNEKENINVNHFAMVGF